MTLHEDLSLSIAITEINKNVVVSVVKSPILLSLSHKSRHKVHRRVSTRHFTDLADKVPQH